MTWTDLMDEAALPEGGMGGSLSGPVLTCPCHDWRFDVRDGRFYALDRRCGHMNAPLDRGTLDGTIVTCAMHCAQFDAATGEALSGPVPPHLGGEVTPPRTAAFLAHVGSLVEQIRTQSVRTYEARVESEWVMVALDDPAMKPADSGGPTSTEPGRSAS